MWVAQEHAAMTVAKGQLITGYSLWSSLVAQMIKNLPAMQETWYDTWVRKVP